MIDQQSLFPSGHKEEMNFGQPGWDPLKILLLEDIPSDAELIEDMLLQAKMNVEIKRVDTRDQFVNELQNFVPDVILSDHSLPRFNSTEAIRVCRQHALDLPFILVTGAVSEEFAVVSLQQGADDYILKSNLKRLPSAILNSLRRKQIEQKRKIDEQTLKEQNSQLTKINEELDRFVYSASHDLRAPLKSVLGLVKLFQDEVRARVFENCQDYLSMMEKSILKLDLTIKDIINYSKNSRTDVFTEEIDLQALAESIFENMKFMDGADRIQMTCSCNTDVQLYADASRLSIILNNLISNSIKYAHPLHAPTVAVRAIIRPDSLTIVIQDNGIGIEEPYLEKIFNMFYRATSKSEGSGLGLYIVKESVKKMNGFISVESVINKGTTFTLQLPNYVARPDGFTEG